MELLYATANLYAFVFKVDVVRSRSSFDSIVRAMAQAGDLTQTTHHASGTELNADEDEDEDKFDPVEYAKLTEKMKSIETGELAPGSTNDGGLVGRMGIRMGCGTWE